MRNYKRWTPNEMSYIKDNYVISSDEKIASELSKITGENITTAMIRRQRRKLKIAKSRGRPKKTNEINLTLDTQ
jgi:hypothetical protein